MQVLCSLRHQQHISLRLLPSRFFLNPSSTITFYRWPSSSSIQTPVDASKRMAELLAMRWLKTIKDHRSPKEQFHSLLIKLYYHLLNSLSLIPICWLLKLYRTMGFRLLCIDEGNISTHCRVASYITWHIFAKRCHVDILLERLFKYFIFQVIGW